jgi:hypothetical protein
MHKKVSFDEIYKRFQALAYYANRLPVVAVDGPHFLDEKQCQRTEWSNFPSKAEMFSAFTETIRRYDGHWYTRYTVAPLACAQLAIQPGEGCQNMLIRIAKYPTRIPTPGRRANWGRRGTYETALTFRQDWHGTGNLIISGTERPRHGGIVNYVRTYYCAVKILDAIQGFGWLADYYDNTEFMDTRDFESLISRHVKMEERYLKDLVARFIDVDPWDAPEMYKLRLKLQPDKRRQSRGIKIRRSSQALKVR